MLDTVRAFLSELARTARFADLIDVILVALFFYAAIGWLRASLSRSASRRAFRAVLIFAAVYVLVRLLQLYLIETLIKGLLIVLLITVVVVFQADLRRLFDRIGGWSLLGRENRPPAAAATVDMLAEAAARLAKTHTGALIVVRGHESWDRQTMGGIPLEGAVSLPLLYSIFNPQTPGHDGAVLIEGERVTRFGSHLPLSKNLVEIGGRGTRHAAALGLSEGCDAFVIVVSEERGTISIAEEGRLVEMTSASELKGRLEAFWQQHYSGTPGARRRWWRRLNLPTALFSVMLASLLWLLFAYQPDTLYRSFVVPIEMRNLPPNWGLEDPVPLQADVTLSGSERAFRLLDPSSLVVSLNLSNVTEGQNDFVIAEDNIQRPNGLSLYRVEPQALQVQAYQMHPIQVPVAVRTTGRLPEALALVGLTPDPATATLLVPAAGRNHPDSIRTEPVDLGKVTASSTVAMNLALPPRTRLQAPQNGQVTIRVAVRPTETPR